MSLCYVPICLRTRLCSCVVQVLDEMCPTCQQQGRQLKLVRMRFNLARLHQEAAGVFDDPNVVSCLVCDQRMKTLFQRLHQHAPRVLPHIVASPSMIENFSDARSGHGLRVFICTSCIHYHGMPECIWSVSHSSAQFFLHAQYPSDKCNLK
jgi:hypothetical protein